MTNAKTYDGTASAAATPTRTAGTLAVDDTATYTETYNTRAVGTGKTLTPAATIKDASLVDVTGNYDITVITNTTGVINGRAITVTAATNTKIYDGTTSAAATPTVTSGAIQAGDTANFTEAYNNKNVGSGNKTLIPSGSVTDGNSGNNYTVTFVNVTTGTITARALTVTAATNTKSYDGTTSAAAPPTVTSGVIQTGDTPNFTESYSNKNVGTAKTLTAGGTVADGNSGNNYTCTFVASTTGVINARRSRSPPLRKPKPTSGTTSATGMPTIDAGALGRATQPNFVRGLRHEERRHREDADASGAVTDGNSGNNYTVYVCHECRRVSLSRGRSRSRRRPTPRRTTARRRGGGADGRRSGRSAAGDTAAFTETYDHQECRHGHKTLTPTGSVNDGNGGNNYTVTFVNDTTGTITDARLRSRRRRTPRPTTARRARRRPDRHVGRHCRSDDTANFTETFDNKNVGTGKTLTPAGTVTDGNGGNNYAYTFVAANTGTITARALTVTAATTHEDVRRHDERLGDADDHGGDAAGHATRRASPRRSTTRTLGTGQDADTGRHGQRRQRRQQLHRTRS